MKVYSDDIPKEIELLQGGKLVRWNVVEIVKEDMKSYEYDEIKIEFTNTKEQIIIKLFDAGYNGDKELFAEKIIQFITE